MKRNLPLAALLGLAACSGNVTTASESGTGGTLPATTSSVTTSSVTPSTVTTSSASTSSTACSDCLTETISWGLSGGLVSATEISSLSSCRAYQAETTQLGGGLPGPSLCTVPDIGGCDAPSPSIRDVEQAFAHPDVVAALAGSTPIYGTDPRPCDGAVTRVIVRSKTIFVGGDCGSSPSCLPGASCVPVPPGVRALVDFLGSIDQHEQPLATCVNGL
jgi:hypothetical protein